MSTTNLSIDFFMDAISPHLRGRRSNTGFINICCPMCREKRRRCGVKPEAFRVAVNCFNCGFSTAWQIGQMLGTRMKEFLQALGVSETECNALQFKALALKQQARDNPELFEAANIPLAFEEPSFAQRDLPAGSINIYDALYGQTCFDPDFLAAAAYIRSRGPELFAENTFYWSPSMPRRVIIPFYARVGIVGYTARAIDPDVERRYLNSAIEPNYLFNLKALYMPNRKFCILVEGVLDALAIDCVGMMGSRLSETQINWLLSQGKEIILQPDRDEQGLKMIDVAIDNGFSVSLPWGKWWDHDCKDVAEATKRYGSLWAVTSIIEGRMTNATQIQVAKKLLIH